MMAAVITVSNILRFTHAQHQVQIANILQIFKRYLNIPVFSQANNFFQSFNTQIIYDIFIIRQMNNHCGDTVFIAIHYTLTIGLKNAVSVQIIHLQTVLFMHWSVHIFYIKSRISCQMNIFLISIASAKFVAPP